MATGKQPFHTRSAIRKHSVKLNGHHTSVTLEDDFWAVLAETAERRGMTIAGLIGSVDGNRQGTNLSSALRLFVLDEVRSGGLKGRR